MIIDISGSSANEWTIETDPNHIFYFSFLVKDDVDEHLLSPSLTVIRFKFVQNWVEPGFGKLVSLLFVCVLQDY